MTSRKVLTGLLADSVYALTDSVRYNNKITSVQ
jgi:hypothetical protein